jgi:hypothetical protein
MIPEPASPKPNAKRPPIFMMVFSRIDVSYACYSFRFLAIWNRWDEDWDWSFVEI